MKKLIMALVMCLFLVPFVNAEFSVADEVVKNIILPGEGAGFFIEVANTEGKEELGIITTDSNWRIKGTTDLVIDGNQKQKVKIELEPMGVIKPGAYAVSLRVFSKINAKAVDHPVVVNYVVFNELIEASLEYNPQGLDPRKENLIKLKLRNKNNIPLDELKIKIASSLFNDEREVSLLPLETRDEELRVSFKDFVEKGSYEVKTSVMLGDKTLIDKTEKINVGYYNDVTEDKVVDDGFLKKSTVLVRENNGNTVSEEEFTVRLNSFEKTFTSAEPEPSEKTSKNNIHYYKWVFRINPGDSYRIEVKTDYLTPLIALVLIIIVGLSAYALLKKDISIRKKVLTIRSGEGISDMKIILIVKNKGAAIKHVQVTDRLPKIVKKPAEYGVVKPTSVKHTGFGDSLVSWDLENMVRGEERVISYKLKSDIRVIGKLHMPVAIARYRTKSGKLVIASSNKNILIS
ncbi:MAG TPA: hypothetical protein VJH95_00610 [Candidatus Nanoarchaeia archaeon]|nr:hypothetical protein [Candidatus Nanoarchaeia archaeon]